MKIIDSYKNHLVANLSPTLSRLAALLLISL